jgi:RHS repeat-associated protein
MMLSYGDNSYTYTANGDLMVKTDTVGTTTYTHDALGNLEQVNLPNNDVISYTYDGRNRRIAKMVNGTVTERFVYQNQLKPAAKVDASGNVLEQYIYGTRINTPDYIIKNSEKYRVVSDERGSVRLVVKVSDGTVAQQIDYNEFGIVIADSNPGFQPFYYAGGVYDLDTQLVKFGARDYDPATGRWLQKEPLGFNGSDNFYSYCDGDPVNRIDVDGLDWLDDLSDYAAGFGDVLSLGFTDILRNWLDIEGVDKSSSYYTAGSYTGVAWWVSFNVCGYNSGYEFKIGKNWRLAPWGNRTGNKMGEKPHYHRRKIDADGNTKPGQGIGRHRPWEKKSTDNSWRNKW